MPVDRYSEYYNMNHKRRGMAIIFNHEYFDDLLLESRDGTNFDRDKLEHTLKGLGFKVEVHDNKKRKNLMKIVDEG
jgi:caspase-like apoptosis-related cysteine protease